MNPQEHRPLCCFKIFIFLIVLVVIRSIVHYEVFVYPHVNHFLSKAPRFDSWNVGFAHNESQTSAPEHSDVCAHLESNASETSRLLCANRGQLNNHSIQHFDFSAATYGSWLDFLTPEEKIKAYRGLERLGVEPTELHDFKSPFLDDPRIYDLLPRLEIFGYTSKPRKRKIISCFKCPDWFSNQPSTENITDFKRCPYNECVFDKSGKHLNESDMVLFFVGYLGRSPVPKRAPGQIWVKAFWESPVHYNYPSTYSSWKSVFNWTFNYRVDSDIFAPNQRMVWRHRSLLLSDQEYLSITKQKTKTAAWFVGHCPTQSKRMVYVERMRKYIDVDIYGKCGNKICTKKDALSCEEMLTTTYKFYLSFENSFCRDYITEKFFRTFNKRSHVIPVVRGGFDYDKYIPSGTFVNTADFKTVKDLALYLKQLGNDSHAYAKMLKEKDKVAAYFQKNDWCDVCQKLHTDRSIKQISDIRAWSHEGACYAPKDL